MTDPGIRDHEASKARNLWSRPPLLPALLLAHTMNGSGSGSGSVPTGRYEGAIATYLPGQVARWLGG